MADPVELQRKADELAQAWLRKPFEMVAETLAAHAYIVNRNDANQYRVALLLDLLKRANERLLENGCQPVEVPDLDWPNIERLMETNPL